MYCNNINLMFGGNTSYFLPWRKKKKKPWRDRLSLRAIPNYLNIKTKS